MASIRQRAGKWQARVRRHGFQPIEKSFQSRQDAEKWARAIEREQDLGAYEIPFNRHFYVFQPPRPLAEIDADLKTVTDRIKAMLEGLSA